MTGWTIEAGGDGSDVEALCSNLAQAVLPLHFEDREGWTWKMKQAIARVARYPNSHRSMRPWSVDACAAGRRGTRPHANKGIA